MSNPSPPPTPQPSQRLPVFALPYKFVILPGSITRISLADRADIQALLQKILTDSGPEKTIDAGGIVVGCVPIAPPAREEVKEEGRGGEGEQKETENGNTEAKNSEAPENAQGDNDSEASTATTRNIDPATATPADLFPIGTIGRVVGLERSNFSGAAIVVEGVSRFRVLNYTQQTPFLEAEVKNVTEDGIDPRDPESLKYLAQLKSLSHTLLVLLRAASRSSPDSPAMPFILAQRLSLFIDRKTPRDAGSLADFFISAIDATFTERLGILEAVDVKQRLRRAVEIVGKKVESLKEQLGVGKDGEGLESDEDRENKMKQIVLRQRRRPAGFFGPPGGMPKIGGGGSDDEASLEDEDMKELEKAVEAAQLSDEARKVVTREVKRLKKMSPAQAEYQVIRNYIDTLLEIPWIATSDDNLDSSTLARAKRQLDEDHFGLEKVKRRLLEYLAVLRLKRVVEEKREAGRKSREERSDTAEEASKTNSSGQDSTSSSPSPHSDSKTKSDPAKPVRSNRIITDKSPILLLAGPPGVGKTSLARSVATALGRKFHRISLGGVRDEAEIRGHRRTYVAAMPGVIVNALRKVKVANPVILLDEIDKVGHANFHGDPSAALLEVLDPEQNWSFNDHYVNIPIDLSKVLFICTANSLDTIPAPLLDRMEMIQLSGYTTLEKKHIAQQYLIPKQLVSNGLEKGQVEITDPVLNKIITSYTLESGVRNLEREIGSVVRAKAVEFANALDSADYKYNPVVTLDLLEEILGIEKYHRELALTESRPGVVTGLVAYSVGGNGSILFIEAADMPGNGRVQLTGKLGEVIKDPNQHAESVEVALSWVKAHAFDLGLTADPDVDIVKNRDVHVHCPAGAVPKDGPSAGAAFTIALISLFSGRPVPGTVAMTGEMSLRGRVTAVGGIKEKLIGALAAGVKTAIVPRHNRKDVRDLPKEVKNGLEIVFASNIYEVMKTVWPAWAMAEKKIATLESVL